MVRSGHHSVSPAPGLTRPQGSFSLSLPTPAPGFTFVLTGEICLSCGQPIHGLGVRFTVFMVTTHAHRGTCARLVAKMLP
jgi:hypothetical protein